MQGFKAIYKRELASYFISPIAYIFIAAFVCLSVLFAFQIGQLFEINQADLQSFFQFHPWLYIVFMPALGMRSWSEEYKNGTYETLFALPIKTQTIVLAKYCASLSIGLIALALTLPLWIAIFLLGNIDNGATLAAYFGSIILAASYLAIATAASAMNNNQIIAFIIGALISFIFTAAGLPLVSSTIGAAFGNFAQIAISNFSIIDQFDTISRGNISLSGLVFFISLITSWLLISVVIVDNKRRGS